MPTGHWEGGEETVRRKLERRRGGEGEDGKRGEGSVEEYTFTTSTISDFKEKTTAVTNVWCLSLATMQLAYTSVINNGFAYVAMVIRNA